MRTRRGTFGAGAIISGMAVVIVLLGPTPAHASDELRLLSLTNHVRASRGLPALTTDSQLTGVAQRWASTLAQRGVISHNTSLPGQVTGWKHLGENVGVGGTVAAIHDGWIGSPTHLTNIVDPTFTRVGFGVVRPDARIFVVQVFMRPESPPPAAAPSTTVARAPVSPASTVALTSGAGSEARAPITPPAASTAAAAAVLQASSAPPSVAMLSPWIVHSLDRLRSMEPATAT